MDNNLWFVQFLHPGKEHSPDDGPLKTWNRLEHQHKRKFLTSPGTYLADGRVEKGKIMFWAEWEPESTVIRKIASPKLFFPRFIYEPFYVLPKSYDGLQNTDPFVFGEHFLYAVCLQPHFLQLRHLSAGSVILFGSCQGGSAFVLDTVFVVDHWLAYTKANYQDLAGAISPDYEAVTMSPLHAESGSNTCSPEKKSCTTESQETLRLYFGATHDKPVQGMYSFFPCRPYGVKTIGFDRPRISLAEIADKKNTGIKKTYVASVGEMKVLWDKVVKQVKERRLFLGVSAEMPERRLTSV